VNVLITICARGGSKGIPGKNIKNINGKPLIAYSINCAKEFAEKYNAKVALSTDDETIKKTALDAGLDTSYIRPAALGGDTVGKIDVLKDILLYEEKIAEHKYDILLDLDVTSPLRNFSDLNKAYETFLSDEKCLTLFSVNPANRNPYFNMVEMDGSGYVHLSKKPEGVLLTRQSTPKVYDLNASFYFYKREFFNLGLKTPICDKAKVLVMDHTCFDLDHPVDFDFMEYLLVNNKLDFNFPY
jgi:CMP-N,N'-diacetyllegionaminic acid synthase